MDLGPDDLADVGEAATLATNKMGMEQGQQASVLVDLNNGKMLEQNDGKPYMHVIHNGYQESETGSQYAYPVRGRGHGARELHTMPRSVHNAFINEFYR